jgi:hypothetical protein
MSSNDSIVGPASQRSDRIAGCLVGLAVGDALGAPLEFLSRHEVRKRYPEGLREMIDSSLWKTGKYTDDTQMALLMLKAFPEMAKSAFGLHQPPPGSSKAADVAHGWNMLALLGLVAFGLYPMLDEAAKKITGDEHAKFRRSGPLGVIENLRLLAAKEKTPTQVATSIFTPNPLTKAVIEGVANHELETGHQIYDQAGWTELNGEETEVPLDGSK